MHNDMMSTNDLMHDLLFWHRYIWRATMKISCSLLELMVDAATTIGWKQCYYTWLYCRDAQKNVVMYFAAATARLRFALLDYTATFREVSKQRYKTCPPQLLAVGSWLLSVVELGSCNRQQPTTNDLFIWSGRDLRPPSSTLRTILVPPSKECHSGYQTPQQ